jgi:hypothetical protein
VSSILPKEVKTIHALFSTHFKDKKDLVNFSSLSISILFDLIIKVKGKSNIVFKQIETLPIPKKIDNRIISRSLRLQCITSHYSELWSEFYCREFKDDFLGSDSFDKWENLEKSWNNNTPFKISVQRKIAELEIDILVAKHFGITLEELILIYNIQFYGLKKIEENTFYDKKGKIVFSESRSQSETSLDRDEWNLIKDSIDVVLYSLLFKNSLLASSYFPALSKLIVLGLPLKLPLNHEPSKCLRASNGISSKPGIACLIAPNLSSMFACSCTSACSCVMVSPSLTSLL